MHDMLPWHDIYANTLPLHQISILEKILRSLAVYLFLIAGLRIAGKRELAQLNPLDLIVLLTLSNTVQNAIIGNDNSVTGGLIGAATLLTVNYALVRVAYTNPAADRLINGDSVPLVQQGQLQRHNLKRELITEPELRAALRRMGRAALIGSGKHQLIPSYQPAGTGQVHEGQRGGKRFATQHTGLPRFADKKTVTRQRGAKRPSRTLLPGSPTGAGKRRG